MGAIILAGRAAEALSGGPATAALAPKVEAEVAAEVTGGGGTASTTTPGAGEVPRAAGGSPSPRSTEVRAESGRTTTIMVLPDLGHPFERLAAFEARVPSYRRAIAMDAAQRWSEAAALYQQAIIEVADAVQIDDEPVWEQATFKIDLERRRSQVLARAARGGTLESRDESGGRPSAGRRANSGPQMTPLDRGRLLRLKVASVRAVIGAPPVALIKATVSALDAALSADHDQSEQPAAIPAAGRPSRQRETEVRLLLCAARAAGGDREGAYLELTRLSREERLDPARSLALATCQAALGNKADALVALAVAVYQMGPSSRFLPGQNRELAASNDWDVLRSDPRFERMFR